MKKILPFLCGMLFLAPVAAQDGGKPVKYRAGRYEIYALNENRGSGSTELLIGAPREVVQKYAPEGTFPNALNAFLVKDSDNGTVWLIDTGFGRNIFPAMEAAGVTPEDVDCILLTHMHGDHIGGMLRDGGKAFPNALVVVSEKEYDYWTSDGEMERLPEGRRGNFISAREVIMQYADAIDILTDGMTAVVGDDLPGDGIFPIAAYGHTPGHTMFLFRDGKEQFLIWGDLIHALAVQMPHPEISVTYDIDPDAARASRLAVLEYIADKNIAAGGMHVPETGVGKVVRDKETGGYAFRFLEPVK